MSALLPVFAWVLILGGLYVGGKLSARAQRWAREDVAAKRWTEQLRETR